MHIIRTFSENLRLRLLSYSKFNLSPSRSMWFWWVEYNADRTTTARWWARKCRRPENVSILSSLLASNDHGDGNEWRQKRHRFITQNNKFARASRFFSTSLYRPCTTTTWKCLIASFMEDVNKRRQISFPLSKLECGPQEINSREIRLHLPFSATWNKRDKDWKKGDSF